MLKENCLSELALHINHINAALSNGNTLAYVAAQRGQVAALTKLLQLGVNLGVPNKQGLTPAHIAAEYGQVEALKAVQELGVNLDASTQAGRTPAQIAQENGHVDAQREISRLLMPTPTIGSNGLFSQQNAENNKRNHGSDDEDQEHGPSNSKNSRS